MCVQFSSSKPTPFQICFLFVWVHTSFDSVLFQFVVPFFCFWNGDKVNFGIVCYPCPVLVVYIFCNLTVYGRVV